VLLERTYYNIVKLLVHKIKVKKWDQKDEMSKRSYNQYCAVARSLDIVGERWTLLIVRELLTGPKRFKDLLEGLPGIWGCAPRDPAAAGSIEGL
jgi:hypothetical protein